MGHEAGDEVQIRTPGGEKNYEIISLKTLYEGG
jgi:transcription elongation GreA/GreB family factor